MVMSAVTHVGASAAGGAVGHAPSGMGGDYNSEILLMLVSTAGIIFIDHARSGQAQPGNQYAALGIVGFVLLFLGQFAPELAFGFTVLIMVSVIFNSPNGIPFLSTNKTTQADATANGVNKTTKGSTSAS